MWARSFVLMFQVKPYDFLVHKILVLRADVGVEVVVRLTTAITVASKVLDVANFEFSPLHFPKPLLD